MSTEELDQWCASRNEQFRAAGIEARQRPFRAWQEYCGEHGIVESIGSATWNNIFSWFEARSRPGAHKIGALFVGAYYYDTEFWPMVVPLVYGRVGLDPFAAVQREMPKDVLSSIANNRQETESYLLVWADSVDCAFGFDDLRRGTGLSATATRFLKSAEDDLRAALRVVNGREGRGAAYQQARMAMEKIMKAMLAARANLDEHALRKGYLHDLTKLARACAGHSSQTDFASLDSDLQQVKPVDDRYSGRSIDDPELWFVCRLALRVSAAVIRELTDRDIRSVVIKKLAQS